MYWCTSVWSAAGVCAIGLSKSLPMPNTHELSRVVVSDAVGAPGRALADAVAPIAADPFAPEASAPLNATTVTDPAAAADSVAVTDVPDTAAGAKARHTSAVPSCTFVRRTSCHAAPAPVTPLATMPACAGSSAAIKASSSSLGADVEKVFVVSVRPAAGAGPGNTTSAVKRPLPPDGGGVAGGGVVAAS